MLASIKWLNEFVAIDDLSADDVAERLTQAGIEVEAVIRGGEGIAADDAVLEISLTPNRGDCLSIHGLARDLAAVLGRPMRRGRVDLDGARELSCGEIRDGAGDAGGVRVSLEDARCPQYAAARIDGVKVVASPPWLRDRLIAHGLRPVNAVVDVTNLQLLENGQPLHAFDVDRLKGGCIRIRCAGEGEELVGIDGSEMKLLGDELVIADAENPVALAGVMGGRESEITEETTSILIECASFEPGPVRRSARRHGLHTDSSHRFERGVDVEGVVEALRGAVARTLSLLRELGQEPVVVGSATHLMPRAFAPQEIVFEPGKVEGHIGLKASESEIAGALDALGFKVSREQSPWKVRVPSWRTDVTRPIDLVEEVVRVLGYERIPSALPPVSAGRALRRRPSPPVEQPAQPVVTYENLERLEGVRDVLCAAGYHEAVNLSMVGPQDQELLLGAAPSLRLRNPLGEESSALRNTLLAGLLTNAALNEARGSERVALFELGAVFPEPSQDGGPERMNLGIVLMGAAYEGWSGGDPPVSAFDLVCALESVTELLELQVVRRSLVEGTAAPAWLHPGVGASLHLAGADAPLGWVGQVHPGLAERWGIEGDVFAAELSLSPLLALARPVTQASPLPRFPSSTRDVALLVDVSLTGQALMAASANWKHEWLQSVRVFDVYLGAGIPEGRKSVALRLTFRSPDASLTDAEVDALEQDWLGHMVATLGAERR